VRWVHGLEWAKELSHRPSGLAQSRPKGVRGLGVKYEREVAKALPLAVHGQWWEFGDARGPGICQTDLVWKGKKWVLVLEVKLTWTKAGHEQLEGLYRPVVEKAVGMPMLGVEVCRGLGREALPRELQVAKSLAGAVELAKAGHMVALHWLGVTPLMGRE